MKTTILKNKNYKIFLLFLLFTSLSGFSQDYGGVSAINNYVTSKEKERGEIVMFNTNGVGKWPVIKNAKCNKNTQACFYEEFKRLVLKEIDAYIRKKVSLSFKGYKKVRLHFIVEKNGKIKHVWFDNKNFKNDKLYKELERLIKKLPIIDGAKFKPRPKSKSKDIRLFRSYPLTLYGSESTKNKKIEP